jgi:hypothetical protein
MTATADRNVERLNTEADRTIKFFQQLDASEWEANIYSEGGHWTVRQILAHLISAEAGNKRIIENILAGGEGTPANFDLDAYNASEVPKWNAAEPGELLDQFRKQREITSRFASRITDEDYHRAGRHPFLGKATILEIFKLILVHNQIHSRDIKRVLDGRRQDGD